MTDQINGINSISQQMVVSSAEVSNVVEEIEEIAKTITGRMQSLAAGTSTQENAAIQLEGVAHQLKLKAEHLEATSSKFKVLECAG